MKLFLFKVHKVYDYYVVAESYESAMRTWDMSGHVCVPTSIEFVNCQGVLVQEVKDDKP